MKNVWLNIADSFKAAERFDKHYYRRMSATARLETVQFLRSIYYKFKNGGLNGSRKRLRRVIKIIQ
ncbi:MAG: hypothetical protein HY762_06490 [Planctomycetes bacterium]|nr:hypothetical protein [Planctomycetota bacterium]